jgi:L-amino acid N-acyltransferase YncA
MKIRKAAKRDIGEIVRMACEFENYLITIDDSLLQESPPENVFKKVLLKGFDDPKHFVIVAEEKGKLIGFADMWAYPEFLHGGLSAYMNNIFIRDGDRGKGTGTALLKAIMKEAKRRGAVALHVPIKSKNVGSIEFHKKKGIDEQLVMMEKRLDR